MAKLGDLCDILNGYAFKSEQYVDSGVRIIRIANVQKGYIEDSAPVFYPIDNIEYKKYELKEGDLLLSLTGNVGRVALLQKEFLPAALNQRVACLRIKDETILLKSFLFNLLNSDYFESKCVESSQGVAQKNMSTEWLKEYDIPLFSIDKQTEISKELDTISALISLRKQQLSKFDELVKSRFIELFGDTILNPYNWDKEPLGKVCDVRDGTHDSPKYYDTGYPLVTSKNLSSGDIDFNDCSLICKNDFDKINERSKVDFGDILMPMIGTVGNPVIVKIKDEFAIKNVALIKFCDNTKVTNIYIQALLKSDYFDSEVLGKVRGGTQKFISLGDIRKLEILVPPIDLQNQFAEFVEQTDKLKFEVKQSLEKLETLKKALMQQYFG